MPRKKNLQTIQAQRQKLQEIERQIIGEMTAEVGEGILSIYLLDPNNSLWQNNPNLLKKMQELSVAKGNPVRTLKALPVQEERATANKFIKLAEKPKINTEDKPENRSAKFTADIPDSDL